MAAPTVSTKAPIRDQVTDENGLVSRPWEVFFRYIKSALDPLGTELSFVIENNKAAATDLLDTSLKGLVFDSGITSQAVVEYLVQRVTTGSGAQEIITTGVFHVAYKPISQAWALVSVGIPGPTAATTTFSITTDGKIKYTSTNITGTPSISRMVCRVRTLAAKNQLYSRAGS